MIRRTPCWATTVLLGIGLMGCASQDRSTRSSLSERGRDSVISRSSLPGAATVGRALEESDAATQRAANLDSLAQ